VAIILNRVKLYLWIFKKKITNSDVLLDDAKQLGVGIKTYILLKWPHFDL